MRITSVIVLKNKILNKELIVMKKLLKGQMILVAGLLVLLSLASCQKSGPKADSCAVCPSTLACSQDNVATAEVDEIEIWFRDGGLDEVTSQTLAVYGDKDPGESNVEYLAFPGAPPQIPHSVEDMLPIKINENTCLDCHAVDAADADTPPVPESHFMNTIMVSGGANDMQVWKVDGEKKSDEMSGTRWNCTLCHTPQATNIKSMKNIF
jgi:nitrate reductase cytochrome c-type subunit